MELFADTASIGELKEILSWGITSGCTTNPKIVAKEKGCNFEQRMKEILKLVEGPVSIEVTTNDSNEMIKEAEEYAKWGRNVVVKIPMGLEGLKAVKVLTKKGIKTNVTACMSMNQALLAAKAGATYVSIFFARIGDMGYDASRVVGETVSLFNKHNFSAKIIVGSIRHMMDINNAALAGAHIITVPYPFFKQMADNPKTTETIDEFLKFWSDFKKTEQ